MSLPVFGIHQSNTMRVEICVLAFLALVAVAYSCPARDGEFATILRNREDCSSFFICSDGTPFLFACPDGLEFNAKLNVCDWPANARCVVDEPKPTWKPRPTTTRRPYRPTTTTRRPKPSKPSTTTRRPHKPRKFEIESQSNE